VIEITFDDVSEAMLVVDKEKDLGFCVTKQYFKEHEFAEFAKMLADNLSALQTVGGLRET
jgi:hypothetical protein